MPRDEEKITLDRLDLYVGPDAGVKGPSTVRLQYRPRQIVVPIGNNAQGPGRRGSMKSHDEIDGNVIIEQDDLESWQLFYATQDLKQGRPIQPGEKMPQTPLRAPNPTHQNNEHDIEKPNAENHEFTRDNDGLGKTEIAFPFIGCIGPDPEGSGDELAFYQGWSAP